jgi:hypothetical protein
MTEFPRGTTAEHAFAEHEHQDLAPGIDRIHAVASAVGSIASADSSIAVFDVIDWVHRVLEPHAAWEDAWLYPDIDRRAGTPPLRVEALLRAHIEREDGFLLQLLEEEAVGVQAITGGGAT